MEDLKHNQSVFLYLFSRRLEKKQSQISSLQNTITDLKEELARKKTDDSDGDSSIDE